MTSTFVVRDLFDRLKQDKFRLNTTFSADVEKVQRVMFHPFADDGDREEALNSWFQRHQPCLFGRVAAAMGSLHYQFLSERDLYESDQQLADRIQSGLLKWRRRSLSPDSAVSTPAHGFILAVHSPRIAYAEPDEVMHHLALEILRLWSCRRTSEPHGELYWEDLYLENPHNNSFVKFSFTVDFFAAAGDGRWWQDHRIPGGLGFTANSVGHMRRYREWYDSKADQKAWGLVTAMETIAKAAETPYGRATWLRGLANGEPFVRGVVCPFEKTRPGLLGKDWTRYGGHLHTDHAVRSEFFRADPQKSVALQREEWLQDFQYLYDPSNDDHHQFIEGVQVLREEVLTVVGSPEVYTKITGPRPRRPTAGMLATEASGYEELEALVESCMKWRLTEQEISQLLALW